MNGMESGPLRRILSSPSLFPSFKKEKCAILRLSVSASVKGHSPAPSAVQPLALISLKIKGLLWANVNDDENTCASQASLSFN